MNWISLTKNKDHWINSTWCCDGGIVSKSCECFIVWWRNIIKRSIGNELYKTSIDYQSGKIIKYFERETQKNFSLKNGVIHGIIQVLFLNMSAQLTRQFGMAPGGEFRAAYRQVKSLFPSMAQPGFWLLIYTRKTMNEKLFTWEYNENVEK